MFLPTLLIVFPFLVDGQVNWVRKVWVTEGFAVTVYRHEDGGGWWQYVHPLENSSDCARLDDWWQAYGYTTGRVSSVENYGNCVKLMRTEDCSGEGLIIREDMRNITNLKDYPDWDDNTRSIMPCVKGQKFVGEPAWYNLVGFGKCSNFPLFLGQGLYKFDSSDSILNDLAAVDRTLEVSSLILSLTPASIITPVVGGLRTFLSLAQGMVQKYEELKEANMISRITKSNVAVARTEIEHCLEELEVMKEQNINFTIETHRYNIHACYNRISVILKQFKEPDIFLSDPLVTTPLLVAFVPSFITLHLLARDLNATTNTRVCESAKSLFRSLETYLKNSFYARVKTIRWHERYLKDPVSGETILREIKKRPAGDKLNDHMWRMCKRNFIITLIENLLKYFREPIGVTDKFVRSFCNKSIATLDMDPSIPIVNGRLGLEWNYGWL